MWKSPSTIMLPSMCFPSFVNQYLTNFDDSTFGTYMLIFVSSFWLLFSWTKGSSFPFFWLFSLNWMQFCVIYIWPHQLFCSFISLYECFRSFYSEPVPILSFLDVLWIPVNGCFVSMVRHGWILSLIHIRSFLPLCEIW